MNTTQARWWTPEDGGAVRCTLCPRGCLVCEGRTGYCGVRKNIGGELRSLSYGHPVSAPIDPIEKKPLAMFMPNTRTFSFGTFGCNLGCVFCQNDSLSRGAYQDGQDYEFLSPESVVKMALDYRCPSISYTYNEPTVFAEYVVDIAQLAHKAGLKNVLVSNGYIGDEASDELYPLIDAANIDMKGFRPEFYPQMCGAELQPVLDSILKLNRLGKHIEITTLVIPGRNDDEKSLTEWLKWAELNLGLEIPLHFSAYHPAYKCRIPRTSPATLYAIRDLALSRGFSNVFLGNI
jgi:pyruvate formate lyase activating enzyme